MKPLENKKNLTNETKKCKLLEKSELYRSLKLTGKVILVIDLNQGGIRNITEYKAETL